jgi:hypothetical protein
VKTEDFFNDSARGTFVTGTAPQNQTPRIYLRGRKRYHVETAPACFFPGVRYKELFVRLALMPIRWRMIGRFRPRLPNFMALRLKYQNCRLAICFSTLIYPRQDMLSSSTCEIGRAFRDFCGSTRTIVLKNVGADPMLGDAPAALDHSQLRCCTVV